ncbi:MAG: hemolysin family protein [Dehalococcoidia bacterium]
MSATFSHLQVPGGLILCAVFVVISGFFSGSETGLYCVNRLRLRLAAHEKSRAAVRLQRLLQDQPGLLFTTLLGTNVANYLAPACLTAVFLTTLSDESGVRREHLAELYTTLILTPIVFIFGEIVPKNVFQRQADRFMLRTSSLLGIAHRAFRTTGLIALQRWTSDLVMRRLHRQPAMGSALHSRIGMYQMLREGAAAGALSRTQASILERVHLLQSVRVGSVMVPRSRTVTLRETATAADVEQTIRETEFSRMPVYRGDRRRIVGVVHLLDLLTAPRDISISQQMRPPVELTPDQPVIEALSILQHKHRRMAIVVDQTGRYVGLVTVKDLVEEIVGELAAW